MSDRYYQPPYDPRLPPVRSSVTTQESTSSRFPPPPLVAGSYSQLPYDSQRPRREPEPDSGPRRQTYEQGERDTASSNPRSYSSQGPPVAPGHRRRPSNAQLPPGIVSSKQPGVHWPPDDAPAGHARPSSDAQRSPENTVSSSQRQSVSTQRPPRDIGSTSYQRQPSDAQWPTDNPASNNPRHPHMPQRVQRDAASTSHQRQFSDPQRFDPPRAPDGGGGGGGGGPPGGGGGGLRGGARSVDLTGRVRILNFPEKNYQWVLGAGAFTDVFKGEYRPVRAPGMADVVPVFVAVKIIRSASDDQQKREDVSRRLIRELSVWVRLNHPNIQPYIGYCTDLGLSVALISTLCGNSTVMKYLAINPSASKLRLVEDVVKGLDYLHSNDVIHGDLQPNNVLVDEMGRARLTDFGRARVIGEAGYSTQMLAGSAAYMAPELFPSTNVDVDNLFSKYSDVYAFGIIYFEIYTNQEPFAAYNACKDWQIVPLIQQGKRPKCSDRVRRQITQDDWAIMEACWTTVPANRLSAAQIIRRMP